MKKIITILLSTVICFGFVEPRKAISIDKKIELGSIFPIDDIIKITVSNNHGTHQLTKKELVTLKKELTTAAFAGGLLIKPTHIIIKIQLREKTVAKPGFVYASTGSIHFDGAINKFGEIFTGTFHLLPKINFDNYK